METPINNAAWQWQDKDWLKARREQWKRIEGQLKQFVRISKLNPYDLRYHKAYFLKGELLTYDEKWLKDSNMIYRKKMLPLYVDKPFHMLPFFKIWYHPETDEKFFEQCAAAQTRDEQRFVQNLARTDYSQFDRNSEFVGNRSYYIDQLLLPKSLEEYNEGLVKYGSDFKPTYVTLRILYAMSRCLYNVGKVNINYLMAFCFELLDDCFAHIDWQDRSINTSTERADTEEIEERIRRIAELYKNLKIPKRTKKDLTLPIKLKDELTQYMSQTRHQHVKTIWDSVVEE